MPLLPPKGRRMSKTRLYPDDIREAVLADIRAFGACRNVRNIAIVPVNGPEAEANWPIDFIADGANFPRLQNSNNRFAEPDATRV